MKPTLLAAAFGLICVGGVVPPAHAQTYGQEGGGDPAQYAQQPSQGSQNGAENGWSGRGSRQAPLGGYAQNEPNEAPEAGVGPGHGVGHGPGHGPHAGGPPSPPPPHGPPPPPNAARFVFQRGSARIEVTCPQVFGLRDCVEAATELLDKIHSLGHGAHHPSAGNGPAGGGPAQQSAPGGGSAPQAAPEPDSGERM